MKFSAGDRVVYRSVSGGGYYTVNGKVGTVAFIYPEKGHPFPYAVEIDGKSKHWPCMEEELEHAV